MTHPSKKFAHEIVLDAQAEQILIDGVAFPYYVMESPEVMTVGDGMLGALEVRILSSNITFIGSDGEARPVVKANKEAELEWARRRAREIVLEGLADIVEQLPRAEIEHARWQSAKRFVNERHALLSLIGNLDGTITADELRKRAGEAMGWSE